MPQQTIVKIFFERANLQPEIPFIRHKQGRGPYQDLTWGQYSQTVEEMAYGLAALGLEPGQSAAIFAQTSHTWVAADMAILANGAFSAPLYATCSGADIKFIFENSEASFAFVQDEVLLNKLLAQKEHLPKLKQIILLSALSKGRSLSDLKTEPGLVIGLEELQDKGRELAKTKPTLIKERVDAASMDSLATVIYTSGTTGTPKGAMITHANIHSLVQSIEDVIPVDKTDVYLSYLPLSHVFERVCGEFYSIYCGDTICFAESIEHMAKNMAEIQPTILIAVPRVMERIFHKVQSGINAKSANQRKLVDWAVGVGKETLKHKSEVKEPGFLLSLKHFIAEKLVLKKLRERIGKRLKMVIVGGAPSTADTIEFFNAIGITTLEGYGLTETTAPTNVNLMGRIKVGTVGPTLKGLEIKIAEDGEICFKGPTIFQGYYKQEEATKAAFSKDGWFLTGDIGEIDSDGYLKITDRKKDLIINAAGKNIAPQRVEAAVRCVPYVNQAVIFGDKQKHMVAIVTLDEPAVTQFARDQGWSFDSYKDLSDLPELKKYLRTEIVSKSQDLADYERVRNFAVLPTDFSIEEGELTASLKVKRQVVAKKYKEIIEKLYHHEDAALSSKR
jgi:long-chain acyl-CoA synthetase